MRFAITLGLAVLAALPAFPAVAAEPSPPEPSLPADRKAASDAPEATSAHGAADAGLLLPSLVAPQIYAGTAYAVARSGYDGAHDAFVARATAEGGIGGVVALRIEYEHGPSLGPDDRMRIGGRVALLRQDEHGVDGGVALFYDPKDFREEGNIIGALLVGRRFGRVGLYADAMFGSDPEGDDQQLELRLAANYRASDQVQLGLDTRGRYNLSSDEKRAGTLTTDWELQALPTLSVALGAIALVADVGLSALQTTGPFGEPTEETDVSLGVLALGGAAGAF